MSEKKVESETKAPETAMAKETKDAKDTKEEPKSEVKPETEAEDKPESKEEAEEKEKDAKEDKEEEPKASEEPQPSPPAKMGFLTRMKSKFLSKPATEVPAAETEPSDEYTLPSGDHDIQLYSNGTHNGQKITCALEEMELKYDAWLIDFAKENQKSKAFLDINPNGKIPAMVDKKAFNGEPANIFETGSILLYLAEKSKKLLPTDPKLKLSCMNWLFFQSAAEPALGQLRHDNKIAATKIKFSMDRSSKEIHRLLKILDDHLVEKDFIVGTELTIADIAWFTMVACLETDYATVISLANYEQVKRWKDAIQSRPSIEKGMKINSTKEEHAEFKEYHSSA